jgi:hypothetical protein
LFTALILGDQSFVAENFKHKYESNDYDIEQRLAERHNHLMSNLIIPTSMLCIAEVYLSPLFQKQLKISSIKMNQTIMTLSRDWLKKGLLKEEGQ